MGGGRYRAAPTLRKIVEFGGAALLLTGATVGSVRGAEWYAQSRVRDDLFYEDNIGFTTRDPISSFGTLGSAGLILGGRTPNLDLSIEGIVRATRFVDNDAQKFDTNDQEVNFRGTQRGERSEVGLTVSYLRDRQRSDEVNILGAQQPVNQRRELVSVEPSFTYALTPTQTLRIDGTYQNVTYPTSSQLREFQFQDYSQYALGTTWLVSLNQRTSAGLGASGFLYDSDIEKAQELSFQGIVQHQLTPRIALDTRVGPGIVRTEIDQRGASNETDVSPSYFVDSGINWDLTRRTHAELRARTGVDPIGNGGVAQRSRVSLDLKHDVTRTVRLSASTIYVHEEDIGGGSSSNTQVRDFVRFEPTIRWSVTKDVDLSLLYRLRYQQFSNTGDDVTSNAVIVRFDLRLPDLRRSW